MDKIIGYAIAVIAVATAAIAWSTLNNKGCCCEPQQQTQQTATAATFDSVMMSPGDTIFLLPGDSIMLKRGGSLSRVVSPGRQGLIYTGAR